MNFGVVLVVLMALSTYWTPECRGQAIDSPNFFRCDENFCLTVELGTGCPAKRNCSTLGNRKYLSPDPCNCCKDTYCAEYIKEGEVCDTTPFQADVNICGPRLTCDTSSKPPKCGKITGTACMKELKLYEDNYEDGTVGTAQFRPDCDDGGRYAQRQCLPGSICFCSNSDGKRIFGMGLRSEAMNCRCSKDLEFLTVTGGFNGKLPRCLPNGNYDPIQCVDRSCWCRHSPEIKQHISNISLLWCYDSELHDTQPVYYLRKCEYDLADIESRKLRADAAGAVLLTANTPKCDPDGYYSPVQSRADKLVCVDREGHQIENFQIVKQSPRASQVDCYCARTRDLMKGNVSGRPECCSNGNFRRWQCSGSLCYCVDRDGKQIVGTGQDEVRKDDLRQLPCYTEDDDNCVY